MLDAVREILCTHWPEYLIEAAGLGAFMVSACGFGALLFHPVSPVAHAIPGEVSRRILMGLHRALAGTACSVLSPAVVVPAEPSLGLARGFVLRDPDGHALQVVQP